MKTNYIIASLIFSITFLLKSMGECTFKVHEVSTLLDLASNKVIDNALAIYRENGFDHMNDYLSNVLSADVVNYVYDKMASNHDAALFGKELLDRFQLKKNYLELFYRFDLCSKVRIIAYLIDELSRSLEFKASESNCSTNAILELIEQLIENNQDLAFYSHIVSMVHPLMKKLEESHEGWSEKIIQERNNNLFLKGKIVRLYKYIEKILAPLQYQSVAPIEFSSAVVDMAKHIIDNCFTEFDLKSDEVLEYIFLKYFAENPDKFEEAKKMEYINLVFSSEQATAYQQASRLFHQFLKYYPKSKDFIYRANLKHFFDNKMKIALFLKNFLLNCLGNRITMILKKVYKVQKLSGRVSKEKLDSLYHIIQQAHQDEGLAFTIDLIIEVIAYLSKRNTKKYSACIKLLQDSLNRLCVKEPIDKNDFKPLFNLIHDKLIV